jgi:hypothetical protein
MNDLMPVNHVLQVVTLVEIRIQVLTYVQVVEKLLIVMRYLLQKDLTMAKFVLQVVMLVEILLHEHISVQQVE